MVFYPRPFIGLFYFPRYVKHWILFNRKNKPLKRLQFKDAYPNLGDWVSVTPFDPHYFYQASWLSRKIANNIPHKHLDIGSDVKLIGVISGFVDTTFIDYRPLKTELSGLECIKGDILAIPISNSVIDSVSCLHVIEHIGLGRYGDPIDPGGSTKALEELERITKSGGFLYLSVPVGLEKICFNAHRIFSPLTIVNSLSNMKLVSFSLVDDAGLFIPECDISYASELEYGCGLFVFQKK